MTVSKINIPARWIHKKKKETSATKSCFKVHLLQQESIRKLYSSRLRTYLNHQAVSTNINIEWKDLKEIILKTANDVLRKRPKRKNKKGLQT
jgi:hypothetical protein